jgi:biopolymer transport protein ExbB/TolQ
VSDDIYHAVFKVAAGLELPVVVAALVALALVLVETGAFAVEVYRRRRRRFPALAAASDNARRALDAGRREEATKVLGAVAWSKEMSRTLDRIVGFAGAPGADVRIAKQLADFDFDRQRRLARTRLLVRAGPALGLMGTLIPLSPALEGLSRGNVAALTENLRVAFSITVLGLFVGALAFGLSLVRDRIYGQDFSDLEYVAAVLTDDRTVPTLEAAAPPTDTVVGGQP